MVIPLWVLAFGEIVFKSEYLAASYSSFVWNIIYLLIPLCIGILIQYFVPCAVKFALRSIICLIDFYVISYIVFIIVSYWNMFASEIFAFTWRVSWLKERKTLKYCVKNHFILSHFQYFLGGFLLPVIAYSFGWLVALILRDEYKDRLELATAALTKNITIVNSAMYITVFFPQTESCIFLSSIIIVAIPIPLVIHQLIHIVIKRSVF